MPTSNLVQRVRNIDEQLRKYPWIDFEVWEYAGSDLKVVGCLDTSDPYDVELRFVDVSFVSIPMEWKTNTSDVVISVATGEIERQLNLRFQNEVEHVCYLLKPEGFQEDFYCVVGAKWVELTCARLPPPRDTESETP